MNRNIAAGLLGNTWTALVQIAFIPLYVRILGIEAYGLIGVYAALQVALSILDMGLIPTLTRETARYTAGAHTVDDIRTLLRSIEIVFLCVALILFVSVVALAPWLAASWLKAEILPVADAIRAFQFMGALIGLRWLCGLYRGAITGLQDLVWLNVSSAAFATIRGAGVVPVLLWSSPTIEAFFLFQAGVTAIELALLHRRTWNLLPSRERPSFSATALRRIWRFSAGVTLIALLYLLLSQSDKVLLSTLLSLKAFGYYALASSVAGALNLLVAPIGGVAYARLNELVARGDEAHLAEAYHRFAQLLTVAIAPAALVLAIFSDRILMLWLRDATTTLETTALVRLLAIGALLNAFLSTPYLLQLALGRTKFIIVLNSAYVLAFMPAIYFGVSAYGAIASAMAWIAINAAGFAIAVPLMHRNMLPREKWKWYVNDIALPAAAALVAAGFVRVAAVAPDDHDRFTGAIAVILALLLAYCSAAAASPAGRQLGMRAWALLRKLRT